MDVVSTSKLCCLVHTLVCAGPWLYPGNKCVHSELAPVAAAVAVTHMHVTHAYGVPSVEGCNPNMCDISECIRAMGLLKTYFVFLCASQGRQRLPVAEAAAAAGGAAAGGAGGAEAHGHSTEQGPAAAAAAAAAAALPEVFQSHQFTMPDKHGVILPGESKTFRWVCVCMCWGEEGGLNREDMYFHGVHGGGGMPAEDWVERQGDQQLGDQQQKPGTNSASHQRLATAQSSSHDVLGEGGVAASGGLLPCHVEDRGVILRW